MRFTVDLLKPPEQETAQTAGFFDLTVARLDDRFALGVVDLTVFAANFSFYTSSDIKGFRWPAP
jgi:hypothetical protein